MAIHNPPLYRYFLFDLWDKRAFALIKKLTKYDKYPKIIGSREDINQFLKMLIRSQKSTHGWRTFLKDMLNQIKQKNTIDTLSLNAKYPPNKVKRGKPQWVTYKEDKIVSNFIDELGKSKIEFVGSDRDISEFVLRFTLGQLCHDWEQTILMIWEMLGNSKRISLKLLNREMRNFDYLGFFN